MTRTRSLFASVVFSILTIFSTSGFAQRTDPATGTPIVLPMNRFQSGTITTDATTNVTVEFSGMGCVGVSVTGTFTGSLAAQQSNDKATWESADLLQQTSGQWPNSLGSAGRYYSGGYAARWFRINGPTTTGTATISLITSIAPCNLYTYAIPGAVAGLGFVGQPADATVTQTSAADVLVGHNVADVHVKWGGSPTGGSGCTIQMKSSGDALTYVAPIGSAAYSVTPGTEAMFPVPGPFSLATQWVYACTAYPSAGSTITLKVVYKPGGRSQQFASLGTFPPATTLTARNSTGAQIYENGSRWTVVSTPAVSVQASASIAAEAAVRHVATGVCFSAGSTVAPALTALTVNLRDGASGLGSVLSSWTVVISAATGQNVNPQCFSIGPLVGTTNTAMTLEFSALLTNLLENVTMMGYNVN